MLFLAALYCCSLSNFQVLGIYWNYVSGKYPINCTTIKCLSDLKMSWILTCDIISVNQVPLVILTNFLQNKFRSSMVRVFNDILRVLLSAFKLDHISDITCSSIAWEHGVLTSWLYGKSILKLFPGGQYGVLVLLQRVRSTHVCPPLLPWPDELRRYRKLNQMNSMRSLHPRRKMQSPSSGTNTRGT